MKNQKQRTLWYIDRISDSEKHNHKITRWVMKKKSKHQMVGIIESFTYGKCLIIDDDLQSSEKDEFIYHEALVHPAMIIHGHPENVLILGGGEGATLREALKYRSVKSVTMVDIDDTVVQVCREYMPSFGSGAFEDPRTKLVIGDAREFILKTSNQYDVIISDLCSPLPEGPAYLLYTQEFYSTLRKKLTPNGVFSAQVDNCSLVNMDVATSICKTLNSIFPVTKMYSCYIPSFDSAWGFCVATVNSSASEVTNTIISERISNLLNDKLKFYDAETHIGMFALPKYVREGISKGTIITEKNPKFIYS